MILRPSSPTTVCTNFSSSSSTTTTTTTKTTTTTTKHSCSTKRRRNSILTSVKGIFCRRKRVTFAPLLQTVTETLSHRDMTDEEKQNTWMQDHEALVIKRHCKRLIRDVEKFHTEDLYDHDTGEKICLRGLESCLTIHAQIKKRIRREARQEVFSEQAAQLKRGGGDYYDDEAIAAVYGLRTRDHQTYAELKANLDRYAIENYVKEFVDIELR